MIRTKYLLSFLILVNLRVVGQSYDPTAKYFARVREGLPGDLVAIVKVEKPEMVLQKALPYFNDSVQGVRSAAYRLTHFIGITSKEIQIRQASTGYLLQGCLGRNGQDGDLALGYLREFRRTDFTSIAKDSLRSSLRKNIVHKSDLIKLAAYLEMQEMAGDFRIITQPGNSQDVRWAALVALARMGDAASLDNILTRVRRLEINDDLVYNTFPDLLFTHQKPAIQYMVDVMKSDNKNCFSADAEQEVAILCGYRIMEQLGSIVKDYPLKLDVSGDIKTKNYGEALIIARNWFDRHPDFVIMNDTY